MSNPTKFDILAQAAERYGKFSFENYSRIRGVAENLVAGLCVYLDDTEKTGCYLVPPQGPWTPQSYRSGAFSTSGGRFSPLEAISFGLAVRVSKTNDWIRLVMTCAKSGNDIKISISNRSSIELSLPVENEQLAMLCDHVHGELVNWFDQHSDNYEHGNYGTHDIGFDIFSSSDTEDD